MVNIVPIQLAKNSDKPLYLQISKQIADLIEAGSLTQGQRLPAIRKLAEQLKVNSITVVKAYQHLVQFGYALSKTGSGFYVGKDDNKSLQITTDFEEMLPDGFQEEEILVMSRGQITLHDNSINFASATPTPDLFPVEEFQQALVEVLNRDKGEAFGYHESSGYWPLRDSISGFLQDNYAIRTTADNIQIISGAQQGIDVIAKAVLRPGEYVLVENPTYTGALAVFKSREAQILGIPIEPDGMNIEALEKSLRRYRPKLVYTMPNYQNPTTYCYSEQKKKRLLELALQYDFYIIEDDFLSDLDFKNTSSHRTLKAIDKYNRVLYIKSFSKVLMPGLRIGFLITPTSLFERIMQAKHATDISSSGFIQRAFDIYLQKGIWGKHLHYMKDIYRQRYETMLNKLEDLQKLGFKWHDPKGGLNFWLELPPEINATEFYYDCEKRDVLLAPGKLFYIPPAAAGEKYVRLSYAAVYPQDIVKGLDKIGEIIKQKRRQTDKLHVHYSPLI